MIFLSRNTNFTVVTKMEQIPDDPIIAHIMRTGEPPWWSWYPKAYDEEEEEEDEEDEYEL